VLAIVPRTATARSEGTRKEAGVLNYLGALASLEPLFCHLPRGSLLGNSEARKEPGSNDPGTASVSLCSYCFCIRASSGAVVGERCVAALITTISAVTMSPLAKYCRLYAAALRAQE